MKSFHLHSMQQSSSMSDEHFLLDRFLEGDDKAFELLYNKYVDQLLSYGKGMGFDDDCLKDAIHDLFCKLYTDRKLVKSIGNLKSYLFRALKNHLLNDLQKNMKNISLEYSERDFILEVNVLDSLIEEEERESIKQTLEKCLSCLTGRQKEAIYLRFIQMMEYDEIGVLLKMTPHSVRKLISRALVRIRTQQLPFSPWILFFLFFIPKK